MKKIIIVMPAYNASKTIKSVFMDMPGAVLKKINKFIVVNDGSTDNIVEVVEELKEAYKIKLINHPKNMGYGKAQKTGFKESLKRDADISVLLHSDNQYSPKVMQKLLLPLEKDEVDVVQGSRMLEKNVLKGGMPLYKYVGNKILTFIENIVFGMDMAEYHSGYMLYSKKALKTIPFERLSDKFHFDGQMLLIAQKKGLRIREIPIPTNYAGKKSYLKPLSYGFEVIKTIIDYWSGKYDL